MPIAPNQLPYWFDQDRAREILAKVIRTDGECLTAHNIQVRATWANQVEQGTAYTGPLVDELEAIKAAAMAQIDAAMDWTDPADVDRYRTQRQSVTDVILAALDRRPNGGGSHDPGLHAYFCAVAAEGEAA